MSSEEDNLTAVLHGKDDLRLECRLIPSPESGEVLIRVRTVGICGSDIHVWREGGIGPFVPGGPLVLGHESSGVVEAVGEGVVGLQKGDRVAMEPGIPCRRCEDCLAGVYNLCPEMRYMSAYPQDGALCRFLVHPADFCHKLPESFSFDDGALLEPLSVAIHAVRRSHVSGGTRVFIAGAGAIGLLCVLMARAFGAERIVVSDVNQARLELVVKMGADATVNVRSLSPSEAAAQIRRHFEGHEPEASIECTGVDSATETCILATRPGGKVALVGLGADRRDVPIQTAFLKEIDIRGVYRLVNTYPTAIRLLASGKIDMSGITRAHYNLEQIREAFDRSVKADVAKVFVDWFCMRGSLLVFAGLFAFDAPLNSATFARWTGRRSLSPFANDSHNANNKCAVVDEYTPLLRIFIETQTVSQIP